MNVGARSVLTAVLLVILAAALGCAPKPHRYCFSDQVEEDGGYFYERDGGYFYERDGGYFYERDGAFIYERDGRSFAVICRRGVRMD